MTGSLLQRRYRVGGTVLSLDAADERIFANFDRLLSSVAVGQDVEPFYSIEARPGPVGEPDGELVFEGEVPEDGFCVMRRAGDATHLCFPGLQSLTLHAGERRAEIVVDPSAGAIAWTIWMMVMEAALDAAGQVLLHAAGLQRAGIGMAVLIHAPSGTGKTTTALALAGAGFGLLADDAVVIGRDQSAWTAWGLPRPVKIHRRTAALLPFLQPALAPGWDGCGEQAVGLAGLGRLLPVEAAMAMRVGAVVHLARAEGPKSTMRPASRAEILAALAADNVRVGRTGLLPQHRRKLDLLGRMCASVPVLRLESGTDLSELGNVVLAGLSACISPPG